MSDEKPITGANTEEYKYWAFISYSHADDAWARWLFKALETYEVPKKLVGQPNRDGILVPPRAAPIFRDRDELPGSAKLTENIEYALRQARYLVVICSPNSVASQWVDQEIRIFKSYGREDRVLCLIVDGEPNVTHRPELGLKECFPEAVRFWVDADRRITEIPTEPIAADARKGKDGKNNSVLKLLAGILGVQYDDLRQRALQRSAQRKRIFQALALIAFAALTLTTVQFWQLKNMAVRNERMALEQTKIAEEKKREAQDQQRKAEEARAAEEKARVEAVKSLAAEKIAKEQEAAARESEHRAKLDAELAKNEAVLAKEEAQKSEQKAVKTLSTSDLTSATSLIEATNQSKALAYLSRALRFDPNNSAVVGRVVTLLSQRSWAIPTPPMTHNDEVTYVEYSTDGKKLLTLAGNAVKLWDATTGQRLAAFQHERKINAASFSPDGKYLVTGSEDSTAQIWDTTTAKKAGPSLPHDGRVTTAVFSPDGKLLATGSTSRNIFVWDVATGKQTIRPFANLGQINSLSFHQQNNWLLVVAQNTAQVWNANTGVSLSPPVYHMLTNGSPAGITAAAFSVSGNYFATASGDKTARIWETTTGQQVGPGFKHDDWVTAIAFSPDDRWLITGSKDHTAKVWEVNGGKLVNTFHHEDEVRDVAFSPNGLWAATASQDGTAVIWDVAGNKPAVQPLKHNGAVNKIAFSADGKYLATASADHTARNWNIVSGKPAFAPFKHGQAVNTAIFSPDGKWVATGSEDRTARVWDLGSGRPVTKPLQHKGRVISLLFTPDGKNLITGAEDGGVRVWDVETEKISTKIATNIMQHGGFVNSLCLSPDGLWLATASDDRTASIWNLADGRPVIPSIIHPNQVKSAVFSADGKWLITSSEQKAVHLWDAATGKPGPEFYGRQNVSPPNVLSMDLSYDGKRVITGFRDNTAVIWDTATGLGTNVLVHDAPVTIVAFSPPNDRFTNQLVLTVAGQLARVWDAGTGTAITEPIKHAETIRTACFSPDGNFFITTFGNNTRVWESATGRAVSDPLPHQDRVRDAHFSADGHLLVTASSDKSARVWFVGVQGKAPRWLGDLANGLGGYILDNGATQMIPDPSTNIVAARTELEHAEPGQYTQWGRWFLAPRGNRSTWAFGSTPIDQFVQQRLADGDENSLIETLEIEPNNPLALAKLGAIAKLPSQAEYLTRLAEHFNPKNPEVLWLRADVLQQQNQLPQALETMERALKLDPRGHPTAFGPDGDGISDDDTDGILAQGWLPKGWVDRSVSAPIEINYQKIDDAPPGLPLAVEMKVTSTGPNYGLLAGPRLVCKKGGRVTIEGWARGLGKSDFSVTLGQLVEPHKYYFDQVVHPALEWKPFKVQFSPQQDMAVELLIRAIAGSDLQIAGIVVGQE